ncbi:spore morphogenesis/germination protein YwcE [Metabacillus sp. 84]|uniref:spore morphogenesis/germination protein YwcE n=1 Tax=unclassified Metabacillus TaxID=2675274 RepID=UPI003CE9EF4D
MDVFVVYLFIATATPLFLWPERKKLALIHIPFIAGMWTYFILYLSGSLNFIDHFVLNMIFVGNVIFAHIAAFLIYAFPIIKREHDKKHSPKSPIIE